MMMRVKVMSVIKYLDDDDDNDDASHLFTEPCSVPRRVGEGKEEDLNGSIHAEQQAADVGHGGQALLRRVRFPFLRLREVTAK